MRRVLLPILLPVLVTALLLGCAAARVPEVGPDGARRVVVGYAAGAVAGGVADWAVPVGSPVELVVASDVADEVHVHGYERRAFVTAGASVTLRFVADVPGVVEVELEGAGVPLARLTVS